ncbi:hypothetical protein AQZ52_05130 [Novosphingobium fuchskuhlense]|uniref:DUF1254 domain-containing protein n=1 Tax=Novosphingobium fuchskuhlense TaxID=1117702 RepID=A0A117UXE7_9SPHN|nr:DUF1254 domain-containing protein [Novosphingobium fuchskuhlense]KUR72624.1 hypothetical protein AQZ52_05130 [Novosphingobium fuchskuhlense]
MMRRLAPFAVVAAAAVGSYYATLAAAPFGLMRLAEAKIASNAPTNHFTHLPPVRAERQFVVRPSPDLLYSACPYDLTAGPLEVTAVPVPGRYSSISVFDARTDVAFVRNDEQMAGRPMRVVLALEGQTVPVGIETVRVRYATGIILQRVLLADPAEAASVDPIRSKARCRTLAGQQ